MARVACRVFSVLGLILPMVLVTACGPGRTSPLDHSLDRVEELLVILEGIGSEADAEAASSRVADWQAGWGLHDHRTAGLESVSGLRYTALLESRESRSGELRTRLRPQISRLDVDPYLGRYERHMASAHAILPLELPE